MTKSKEELDDAIPDAAEALAAKAEDLAGDGEDYTDPEASGGGEAPAEEEKPAEAEAVAEPAAEADPYAQIIKEGDTNVPRYFWGKPISELARSAQNADTLITTQGTRANIAEERAKVLQATLDVIREAREQRSAPAPAQSEFRRAREIIDDPEGALEESAEVGKRRALTEINPKLDAITAKLTAFENKQQLNDIAQVAERARQRLNVPLDRWQAAGEFIFARAGTTNPFSEEAWVDAYQKFDAAAGHPAQRPSIPQASMTSGNPPGGSRRTAVASAPTPLKPRVRPLIRDMGNVIAELGLLEGSAASERIEMKLREKEGASNGR